MYVFLSFVVRLNKVILFPALQMTERSFNVNSISSFGFHTSFLPEYVSISTVSPLYTLSLYESSKFLKEYSCRSPLTNEKQINFFPTIIPPLQTQNNPKSYQFA